MQSTLHLARRKLVKKKRIFKVIFSIYYCYCYYYYLLLLIWFVFLQENRSLTVIDFTDCHLGATFGHEIGDMLIFNHSLKVLKIVGNELGPAASVEIANSLKVMHCN